MRISEYPEVASMLTSDKILIDGERGAKSVSAESLARGIVELAGDPDVVSPEIYALIDKSNKPELHRNTYRGKNLGTSFTDAQKSEVAAGTFKDLFIGDYWEIGGFLWRIVDINYWLNSGHPSCTTPHLVIMPDSQLYTAQMNETNTTEGGYVGSKMYTENLENAKTLVNSAFGVANILNHTEYLTNGVSNGYPSSIAWYYSTLELPNEIMMYGSYVFAPASNGSSLPPTKNTVDKTQLALMQYYPRFINPERQNQWLRDVVYGSLFACVGVDGLAHCLGSANSLGVRPVFGITG